MVLLGGSLAHLPQFSVRVQGPGIESYKGLPAETLLISLLMSLLLSVSFINKKNYILKNLKGGWPEK